jgi:hypothetical protein
MRRIRRVGVHIVTDVGRDREIVSLGGGDRLPAELARSG